MGSVYFAGWSCACSNAVRRSVPRPDGANAIQSALDHPEIRFNLQAEFARDSKG